MGSIRTIFKIGWLLGMLLQSACGQRATNESEKVGVSNAVNFAHGAPPGGIHRALPSGTSEMKVRRYIDARSALTDIILRENPTVIGFGEFHQSTTTRDIKSALARFEQELMPLIGSASSDLIVETWIPRGCGQVEADVLEEMETVAQRPKQTENETVQLIRTAEQLGVAPHILDVSCSQYQSLFDTSGEIDYLRMLELVGSLMGDKAAKALAYRQSHPVDGRWRVLLYGGAIHNDLHFNEDWRGCTFGPKLNALGVKYLAIDLFVPEFIRSSPLVQNEPWYPLFEKNVSADHAVLIEKAPNSYIIIFKTGVLNS
jgi:hypothetical protein